MASDYLLEIDGIKGESSDRDHKGSIEVESFSWGLSNASSAIAGGGGGGGASGKVSFQDFHFVKRADSTSPTLMLRCASGEHIKKATLFVRKAGGKGDQQDYMKIELKEVLVSSYQQGGSQAGDGDSTPTDQFSLNFTKIEYSHAQQEADGSLDKVTVAGWDIKTSSKI